MEFGKDAVAHYSRLHIRAPNFFASESLWSVAIVLFCKYVALLTDACSFSDVLSVFSRDSCMFAVAYMCCVVQAVAINSCVDWLGRLLADDNDRQAAAWQDCGLWTPVMYAAMAGSLECVECPTSSRAVMRLYMGHCACYRQRPYLHSYELELCSHGLVSAVCPLREIILVCMWRFQ